MCKYISCNQHRHKSIANSDKNLCHHIFSFVTTPDNIWYAYWYNKREPNHKGILYTRIFWNCSNNACKANHHNKSYHKLTDHNFSYTLHHFFLLSLSHSNHSVNTLPLLSKDSSKPKMSEHETQHGENYDSPPIESFHRKKIKDKVIEVYLPFFFRRENIFSFYEFTVSILFFSKFTIHWMPNLSRSEP